VDVNCSKKVAADPECASTSVCTKVCGEADLESLRRDKQFLKFDLLMGIPRSWEALKASDKESTTYTWTSVEMCRAIP